MKTFLGGSRGSVEIWHHSLTEEEYLNRQLHCGGWQTAGGRNQGHTAQKMGRAMIRDMNELGVTREVVLEELCC